MENLLNLYSDSVATLAVVATIMLVQLIIADVLGISRKHVPGTNVRGDHSDVLFRATRAVANTNESIAIFICALLFCIFSGASPTYTAYAAWGYALFRTAYAICYYCNLQTPRSICFGGSAISLVALVLVGVLS